ncbi:hypothetical protein RB595_000382 [Gaeumannomyces hyphopodioides]
MSIRIVLDNGPPEQYTNLDVVSGRVVLSLTRAEQVGAVVVKLEGESRTALGVPATDPNLPPGSYPHNPRVRPGRRNYGPPGAPGSIVHENHKILYRVQQVFPGPEVPPHAVPVWLNPGQHTFQFRFKIPMDNGCGDPNSMAQLGGLGGAGGFGDSAGGLFGIGGIRVMDGSRQLLYSHVTKQLPPTFAGLPHQAEVGYYVKVTVQRPGLLKENWRYQLNFRLLPLEPPRVIPTGQEAYARRPFTFHPRSPGSTAAAESGGKKKGFFSSSSKSNNPFFSHSSSPSSAANAGEGGSNDANGNNSGTNGNGNSTTGTPAADQPLQRGLPPAVEVSARLPYPSILTMGKPLPLRMIARKLAPSLEPVFLTSLHAELVASTTVRCQDLTNVETNRWVVVSRPNLSVPVVAPDGPVNDELVLPADSLWGGADCRVPGALGQAGMTPTFTTCNLSRTFRLEIKVGLSWGLRATLPRGTQPQTILLPLVFSSIDVYSGLVSLERKAAEQAAATSGVTSGESSSSGAAHRPAATAGVPPALPPRRPTMPSQAATTAGPTQGGQPGEFEEPPPSYEEAMNSKT